MLATPVFSQTAADAGPTQPGQPVQVTDAWVRAAVPGQSGTGAFMKITTRQTTQLVGVSSPVAGIAEVHQMKMENDVMKMRPVPALNLPAGQTVQLKPGGYHVMLMDLKQALPKGSSVPLTLHFRDGKGVESKLALKLPVSAGAPAAASGQAGSHGHKH